MQNNKPKGISGGGLVLCVLCLALSVLCVTCVNQATDQIRPSDITIVVIDKSDQPPHFPSQSARQHTIDGMLQAASDLNVDLIFQSETAFDTVQFFFDSLYSVDIDGVVYAQAYNQQAVDGIDSSTYLPVPVITVDISQQDANTMEPLVNIAASPALTARQILDYVRAQQLRHGLCIFDSVNTGPSAFDVICAMLARATNDDVVSFDTVALSGTPQNNIITINDAIDQYDAIDTLLFHSTEAAQQYLQRVPRVSSSAFTIGSLSFEPLTSQELVSNNIDFVVHEDFFAKGYLAVLHLSLYIISGQVAGVGVRHIESGSHIIAQ